MGLDEQDVGLRLIHSLDLGAMAWFGWLRCRRQDPPSWAHGGWAFKSRAAPLMIQQINAGKAAQTGKIVALALFDAANAFASSEKVALNLVANEYWGRMHAVELEDYNTYTHMQLQMPGGLQYYRPMQRGFMGHVWAPMESNVDYHRPVTSGSSRGGGSGMSAGSSWGATRPMDHCMILR